MGQCYGFISAQRRLQTRSRQEVRGEEGRRGGKKEGMKGKRGGDEEGIEGEDE